MAQRSEEKDRGGSGRWSVISTISKDREATAGMFAIHSSEQELVFSERAGHLIGKRGVLLLILGIDWENQKPVQIE